ncbi:hypothetical protein [Methanococcus maripaludis]|uniref:HEAT repeat protein n=2 Tax=Methanococcus maripaludis TaxID=39152 RepID=A0A7J9PFU2_METMI|nr:hypothetical protein [Methanococcus maripaludis]MBA2861664.1 HEAT repeat protein [Methanococcus maripaludis]
MIGSFKSTEYHLNQKNSANKKGMTSFDFSNFQDVLAAGKYAFENGESIKYFIPSYEKALNGDFKIKWAALNSLSMVSKASPSEVLPLVPKIAELLENPDWRIRKNAVLFFGDFGLICYDNIKQYMENLKKCFDDSNIDVICATAYAVSKIMLNSKCEEKIDLFEILREKITSKAILMDLIKNIGEINPDLIKCCQNDVLSCLDSNDSALKSKVIKILGDIKDYELDENTSKILIDSLKSDDLEIRRSSIYSIWKYSEKYPEYLKNALDTLFEFTSSPDKYTKIYSLLALNKLSYTEPLKFENLNINPLLDEDLDVIYPSITLLYNLSKYSPKVTTRHYKKVCVLMNNPDKYISKQALRIVGNLGKYDQKYINRYINNVRLKLSDEELSKEATIAMVKSGYIERKNLEIILKAADKAKYNMEFLREVIEEYPKEFLSSLERELINLRRTWNQEYINDLCYSIKEKVSSNDPDFTDIKLERPEIEEPPVIVALKSECTEVELEDGKQVYILDKSKCIETSLSGDLLELLDVENKNEFDIYKLSHDLMIQSLIESAINEPKR